MLPTAQIPETGLFRGLLIPEVHFCATRQPAPEDQLFPQERDCVQTARSPRRADYNTGRLCARSALDYLGMGRTVIPTGLRGMPLWPQGVSGSISHAAGFWCAAVSDSKRSVGIDVERLDRRLDASVLERVCTTSEIDAIKRWEADGMDAAAVVVFSAKEALYKCLYPLVGTFIGFHAAEVDIDWDSDRFTIILLEDLDSEWTVGTVLNGRYSLGTDFVLTAIILEGPER
jgi:4'-phosphopantetheinyl transferase EntD